MTVRNLMKVAAGMVCATAPSLAPAEHLHHHALQVAVEMPSGTFYQMKAKELPGKGSGEDGKILPQDTLFFIPKDENGKIVGASVQQNVTNYEVDSTGRFNWVEINGECKLTLGQSPGPKLTFKDGHTVIGQYGHRDGLGETVSPVSTSPRPSTPTIDSCTYQGQKVSLRSLDLKNG